MTGLCAQNRYNHMFKHCSVYTEIEGIIICLYSRPVFLYSILANTNCIRAYSRAYNTKSGAYMVSKDIDKQLEAQIYFL